MSQTTPPGVSTFTKDWFRHLCVEHAIGAEIARLDAKAETMRLRGYTTWAEATAEEQCQDADMAARSARLLEVAEGSEQAETEPLPATPSTQPAQMDLFGADPLGAKANRRERLDRKHVVEQAAKRRL